MTKVMLIDDDESLQVLIGQIAERDGYEYCCASAGTEGLDLLRTEQPDFLILDVMLPDINGFEICELIRAEGNKVPILFLSAKGDIVDKSIGFKVGADDYLVKPFQLEELSLRIKAHLRRQANRVVDGAEPRETRCLSRGIWRCFGRYEVRLRGVAVPLSSREFAAGAARLGSRQRVHARSDYGSIFGATWMRADPSSITVFVRRIRREIEDDPSKPRYLNTVGAWATVWLTV